MPDGSKHYVTKLAALMILCEERGVTAVNVENKSRTESQFSRLQTSLDKIYMLRPGPELSTLLFIHCAFNAYIRIRCSCRQNKSELLSLIKDGSPKGKNTPLRKWPLVLDLIYK